MGADIESKAAEPVRSDSSSGDVPRKGSVTMERDLPAEEWDHYRSTKRGLTPRHVQLMAIGGSIGTGLFVGIGGPLSTAGPLNVLLGYLAWGLGFIWPCCLCVGEMMAYLPVRGTIFELASRYVDPALGFAMGWTYFFAGAMLVCVEYSAVATVFQYWFPADEINPAVWVALALVVCYILNVVAVGWYGETEFIMAATKVLLIIGLILLTFITMVGGNPRGDAYGFRYWTNGNAMHAYYTTGTTGRFLGWFITLRYAAFTVGGPDLICLAAGEIKNPRRTLPRVSRLIFYRLVGFYVLGVFAVGILCNSRDDRLLGAIKDGAAGAAASPWVLGIQNLGITGLPDLINALILLSGWSCGNAYLYSSSRTLYGLARDGQAPKFLMKCTKNGVPFWAVTVVQLIGCLTFMVSSNSSVTVFYWFVDLTTCALILTQTGMFITFIGWYNALKAQGISRTRGDTSLPYISPFAPWTSYWSIGFGMVVMIFIGFDNFVPWSTQGFVTSYFGLAFGVFMFALWKVLKRTKIVPSASVDLVSGKKEMDEECAQWEKGGIEENEKRRLAQMGVARRFWERIW